MKRVTIEVNDVVLEERLKKYNKKFKVSTLMDDMKFRMVCESKGAIEEILRVILKDGMLVVVESIKQKTEDMPMFHGVILDCRCRLKTGEYVDIEVQISLDDDPVKRTRYNASMLTVEHSPKSKRFKYKNIPTVILIMFCNFDLFKKGKAIYEIERIVKGTKVKSDNGVREIYVNTTARTADKKLKSLFKIMATINDIDDKTFPKLSKKKLEVNDLYIGGDKNMAGLDLMMYKDGVKDGRAEGREEGRVEGRVEGMKQLLIDQFNHNLVSKEYAANKLNMTVDKFLRLAK